jgi:hypothetical protein
MNKDKRITQEEFIEFLTESWTCAFRNLAKNVSHSGNDGEFQGINNLQNDNLATMVENFGTANRDAMVKKSIDEFGKFDLDKNGVTYYFLSENSIGTSRISKNG